VEHRAASAGDADIEDAPRARACARETSKFERLLPQRDRRAVHFVTRRTLIELTR
jgi:hypothetical protein